MFGIEFSRFSPSFPNRAYLSRERMELLRQFQPALLTLLTNNYMAHRSNLPDTQNMSHFYAENAKRKNSHLEASLPYAAVLNER